MKVLKQPDTNWSVNHTCTNCTAVLQVEKSDITVRHYDGDFRESGYDSFVATCPVCKEAFSILTSEMPKAVIAAIKSGR